MKLKNILLTVTNIETSKLFYQSLFGLQVIADFGGNVILTEGLVLQEQNAWKELIGQEVCTGGHDAELYFEERDMDAFLKKLESSSFSVKYLNPCAERGWGQRVVRIYDPDQHVIEIAEAMEQGVQK